MTTSLQGLVQRWHEQPRAGLIRLVLLDIDGCLTAGEAAPLNLAVLEQLQQYNLRAAADPLVPAITLCTGRQEPYVEFMVQAIGAYLPAIWENGAGLFLPADYRFRLHPLLDRARLEALDQARSAIRQALLRPGLAYPQPGKELSITLYPEPGYSLDELFARASEAMAELQPYCWVQRGATTVEVLPVGIHKGTGTRFLLDQLDLSREHVLGVGDSASDIEIFRATAFGATPANGHPALKAAAHFVAPRESSRGVLDILDWCLAHNRSAAERS